MNHRIVRCCVPFGQLKRRSGNGLEASQQLLCPGVTEDLQPAEDGTVQTVRRLTVFAVDLHERLRLEGVGGLDADALPETGDVVVLGRERLEERERAPFAHIVAHLFEVGELQRHDHVDGQDVDHRVPEPFGPSGRGAARRGNSACFSLHIFYRQLLQVCHGY